LGAGPCTVRDVGGKSSLKRGQELMYPLKQEVDSHAGRSSTVNCIGHPSRKAALCVVGLLGALFVTPVVCHRSRRYKYEVTEKARTNRLPADTRLFIPNKLGSTGRRPGSVPESAEIFCDSECSPPFNTPSRSAPRNRALSNFVVSSFLGDGSKCVKLQDKSQLIGFVSLKFQTAGVMGFRI
jgi:hypothetical protein